MCDNKELTVWHTFAATVWLDIHHIMRAKASRGCQFMLAEIKRLRKEANGYLQFSKGIVHPAIWPDGNDKFLHNLLLLVLRQVVLDIHYCCKVLEFKERGRSDWPEVKNRLYSQNPILAGMILFYLILKLQKIGVGLVNGWGTAIFPAHLYNALLVNDPSIKHWKSMDRVIELHGEDQVFVGSAPKTSLSYFRQVNVMMGCSIRQFAKNRRDYAPVDSKKGARSLKLSSPLGDLFLAGLDEECSVALTLHNVEALLLEQIKQSELAADPQNKALRKSWKDS
ncbi:hypothetical protein PVAG01_05336 [Phlyctema vagabunda]|uniref:Uncharacterized protein n=1 Tax=Phlyctema vagabunda TaxID=108571 RepID=A0ABR4PJR1_9HELO